jgi:hypothetical protein
VFASLNPQVRTMLERSGAMDRLGADAVHETLRLAVLKFEGGSQGR